MSAKEHAAKLEPKRAATTRARHSRRRSEGEQIFAGGSTAILSIEGDSEASLLDILDHVLNSGVVLHGSLVISLAGVDLVYVGLNVVLTSVETALRHLHATPGSS